MPETAHINYRYAVDFAARMAPEGKILDYGCGAGTVVSLGREVGLDIYGVEAFYSGSKVREPIEKLGFLGVVVREITDGKIPFDDNTFDVVLSNQVFEHVEDLTGVLAEIARVLKPGGTLLSLFPSNEVIREGHIGIPFVHWFPRDSKVRYAYTFLCRLLGAGYHRGNKSVAEWTQHDLDWIDKYTYYRGRKDIYASFEVCGLELRHAEMDYIKYRLGHSRLRRLAGLLKLPLALRVAPWVFRRLAGMVLVAQKSS